MGQALAASKCNSQVSSNTWKSTGKMYENVCSVIFSFVLQLEMDPIAVLIAQSIRVELPAAWQVPPHHVSAAAGRWFFATKHQKRASESP